jgi:ribonucleoside-diphosphate reductase alpha chain
MPGLLEEVKKQVNRPVADLAISSDDTDIVVKAADVTPGNGHGKSGHGHAHQVTKLSDSVAHFQMDAPTCPNCGHMAVRNGACYKCLNCGESLGCS